MTTDLTSNANAENEDFPAAEIIYTEQQIAAALDQLAITLNDTMAGTNPVVLCVMNGGLIFTGHLLTRINFQCELDFMRRDMRTRRRGIHWSGCLIQNPH